MTEVELRADDRGQAVGTALILGHEAAAVEAAHRCHAVGVSRGDAHAYARAHAVAGDRDRTVSRTFKLVEIRRTVGADRLGGERPHQWPHLLEELAARFFLRH